MQWSLSTCSTRVYTDRSLGFISHVVAHPGLAPFSTLGVPYYRKLTLHEFKVLEINAT